MNQQLRPYRRRRISPQIALLVALFAALIGSSDVARAKIVSYFDFNDMSTNNDGTTAVVINNSQGVPSLTLVEDSGPLADLNGQGGTSYTDAAGTSHSSGQSVGWTTGILDSSVDPNDYWLLDLDTTGYTDLSLRFDYRLTDAVFQGDTLLGPTQLTVDWSAGGSAFATIQTFDLNRNNSYNEFVLDLSSIDALENTTDAKLRGTWSNDGSELIAGGAAPSARLDNLQVTAVPEPATATLVLSIMMLWVTFCCRGARTQSGPFTNRSRWTRWDNKWHSHYPRARPPGRAIAPFRYCIRVAAAIGFMAVAALNARAQDYGGYPNPATNPSSGLMLDLPGTGTDPTAISYGALPVLSGVHSVISQGDSTWQFRLHNYMTYFDDKFWMMWSHGPTIEDDPTQHVRYVTSVDGVHWSPEQLVVGPSSQPGFRYIARGFWQREGELYALASHDEAGKYFGDSLELLGFQWNSTSEQWTPVGTLADDTINNFEPKQLPAGEWMMSRRGNNYATDPSDRSWLVGGVDALDDWTNSPIPVAANNARLEEPDFYVLPDGNLVSLYRDNSGSKRLYRSFSTDNGQSWSQPVPTNFPDATAKFYDLKTSRGYYILVNNANPAGRNPLTLSISQDGLVYTQMATLGIPGDGTFQYPHAIEHDGNIYVAFSRNKTSIELMQVSLDAIGQILDYVPKPQPFPGLLNGDFEDSTGTFPHHWTIVRSTPIPHAGLNDSSKAVYLPKQSAGGARIEQTLQKIPGPEWQLDLLFAMEDPGDANARGLNIILPNTVGGGNLNLRVNGDGTVQTVTSNPAVTWIDVPNLAERVEFSRDANGDGDFSDPEDTRNVHRLLVTGDFTGSPEYTVQISAANSLEMVASGIADRWYGTAPGAGSSISSVIFSAQNSSGSFVVDAVALRRLNALAGDYNGDGEVNLADYTVWRDSLGSTSQLAADGDRNGTINRTDFFVWRNHFGNQAPLDNTIGVPEPSTCWTSIGLVLSNRITWLLGGKHYLRRFQ